MANLSTQLKSLILGRSQIFGSIPSGIENLIGLMEFGMEANSITGTIPVGIGKLTKLLILDFSKNIIFLNTTYLYSMSLEENNLQGNIPSSLGNCGHLEELFLQGNNLSASEVENLKQLGALDISYNSLSGEIPSTLGNCFSLEHLSMDHNLLQGTIPSSLSNLKVAILCCKRKLRAKPSIMSSLGNRCLKVSYAELLKATNGFSLSNLIGEGSYGSVYKGILDHDETLVAVKVFNLQQCGALKSFNAECEALRNIRHRSLVKILTSCSSIDFQGNDFKALVLEYMGV
ncbi:uncharacterized protein LOC143850180 [Tasmannia lanceolata]|uniref:uncharacterized protein LOC143850180 n=1 Tax=Tasmannia lanceolata TaxID=3420 RepID=UPI004062EF83